MAGADDAKIRIGGDEKPLLQSLRSATGALRNWSSGTQSIFSGVTSSVGSLSGALSAVASPVTALIGVFGTLATVAGGAAFGAAIDESRKLTSEAMRLSRSLGVTSVEASALNTALGDIGSDSDTYVGAFNHFAKALRSNEDQLKSMGLQTRDANGHLRDSQTLFQEALKLSGEYAVGLDQTTASQILFGKSAEEAKTLQKLNNEVLEEARKKNEELGLTITRSNVEANKKYKAAMNDLGDVLSAVKKVVGDAVMPIFTRFGQWLSSAGPVAVQIMRGAMAGLVTVFEGFRFVVASGIEALIAYGKTVMDWGTFLGSAWAAIRRGDFSGVGAAWKTMSESMAANWRTAMASIKSDYLETGKRIEEIKNPSQTAAAGPTGGTRRMGEFKTASSSSAAEKSRMPEFEAGLAALKEARQRENVESRQFREFGKAEERDYWKRISEMQGVSMDDRAKAYRKYVDAATVIQRSEFDALIAGLRSQEAALGQNFEARRALAQQEADLKRKAFGDESKEAIEADRRVLDLARQREQQLEQIRLGAFKAYESQKLAELDLAQEAYRAEAEFRGFSLQQVLEREIQFEQERAAIKRQYAQAALDSVDPEKDPVKYEQLKQQLLEIEQQYQAKRAEIQIQGATKAMEPLRNVYGSVESSLNGALKGMLTRTQTWQQGMRSVFTSVGSTLIEELVTKPLAAMAVKWLKERIYAMASVSAKAAEAGAGAASSVASIPFYGWAMALPTMASVFAGVAGISSSIASAAGGFDIPAGLNPITQLHEREMVLPAPLADVIRGGVGGGGSGRGDTYVIHALDGESVERVLHRHAATVASAAERGYREYGFRPS